MSLNGLDSPDVCDASQSAVTEASGWFLLKYTSRDAVELLGRGSNGVSEARSAITGYKESSPLYGLIMYRRRKIIIKYMPEGTSRVLQARTAVHFSEILDRYSPYETVLEIGAGEALNDTALAASFQLHTASPSPAAFNPLDEIREDGEDGGPAVAAATVSSPDMSSGSGKSQLYKAERKPESTWKMTAERPQRTSSLLPAPRSPPLQSLLTTMPPPRKASISRFLVRDESGRTSVTPLEASSTHASGIELRTSESSTRSSDSPHICHDSASQTTAGASESTEASGVPGSPEKVQRQRANMADEPIRRNPETPAEKPPCPIKESDTHVNERVLSRPLDDDDPYDLRKYDEWFKPKVKLGPRPVATPDKIKRPTVAKLSTVPTNFKQSARKQEITAKKQELARPHSSTAPSTMTCPPLLPSLPLDFTPTPPPIPGEMTYTSRPASRGSAKSGSTHKSSGVTPDKHRLMKALELRKKQLSKSQELQSSKDPSDEQALTALQTSDSLHLKAKKVAGSPQTKLTLTAILDDIHQSCEADSGIDLREEEHRGSGTMLTSAHLTDEAIVLSESFRERSERAACTAVLEQSNSGTKNGAVDSKTDLPEKATTLSESIESDSNEQEAVVPVNSMPDLSAYTLSRASPSTGTASESGMHPDNDQDKRHSTRKERSKRLSFSPRRQQSDIALRGRGLVEFPHAEVVSGNPDDFISDDDDLLEELQSATLQEARPIMVSRSQLFPGRKPSVENVGSVRSVNITRSAPMPVVVPCLTPDRLVTESYNYMRPSSNPPVDGQDHLSATSRNVSSGISRRIQALAELSSRPLNTEMSLQDLRRSSHRSLNASFRKHSAHRGLQPSASNISNENATVWNGQQDAVTNRNSVSVTARIVRPQVVNETNAEEAELLPSELMMNHRHGLDREDGSPLINISATQSTTSLPQLTSSTSRHSGEIRQSRLGSRFGRSKQPTSPGPDFLPSKSGQWDASNPSLLSIDDGTGSKEGGRTSRFLKRVSNINFGGSKWRNDKPFASTAVNVASSGMDNEVIDVAPAEQQISRSSTATEKADMPPAVLVGDLNVQFPDSLLWKRRIVTIDDSGYLLFTVAQAMEIHKGVAVKQFPLSEMFLPYAPDLDVEELAHSLVLEFHDGSSLQLACEDAMTQRQVLSLLTTYWSAWTRGV